MKYKENIILKNGQDCMILNVLYEDGSRCRICM